MLLVLFSVCWLKMGSKNVVHVAGGLGNQLFQLAFGLSQSKGNELCLESILGHPRRNFRGELEITEFVLPKNVFVGGSSPNRLLSKLLNLQIRETTQKSVATYKLNLMTIVSELLLSFRYGRWISIYRSVGVGYSSKGKTFRNNYFVGYFQTYKWFQLEDVKSQMQGMRIKSPAPQFEYFKKLAQIEHPIIIHVRRGDYKNEKGIGIVGLDYYVNAIKSAEDKSRPDAKYWVFSDDLVEAKELLSFLSEKSVRYIEDDWHSSALTLEIMRLGESFILANSTFGYWAAQLSFSNTDFVIVPNPWFQNAESPRDIIPEGWTRINTHTPDN